MSVIVPSRIGMLVAAAVVSVVISDARAQISFTQLGALTYPTDVSNDGAIVAGRDYPSYGLYRWTKDSGAVLLRQNALATGVSGDGQRLVANVIPSTGGTVGILKWNATDGFSDLATSNGRFLFGAGISGDGQIVVGTSNSVAVRWVGTTPEDLGAVQGGHSSSAVAISDDGKTVVGYATVGDPGVAHAFRWTEATGMIDLGTLGGINSAATNVSADGAFVVGSGVRSASQGGINAFIWSQPNGYTTIGPGVPVAVATDGSLVVGSFYPRNFSLEQGFVWSPRSGFREFPSVLKEDYGFGSSLDGWQNLVPTQMSADGRYIVGYGLSLQGMTEGWLLDRGLNPPDIVPVPFPAVPEPGAIGLLSASLLVGVIVVKLRRRQRA